jgi:hypothetical protein
MTGIFRIVESSATQWYQDVPQLKSFFFIVTSIVYGSNHFVAGMDYGHDCKKFFVIHSWGIPVPIDSSWPLQRFYCRIVAFAPQNVTVDPGNHFQVSHSVVTIRITNFHELVKLFNVIMCVNCTPEIKSGSKYSHKMCRQGKLTFFISIGQGFWQLHPFVLTNVQSWTRFITVTTLEQRYKNPGLQPVLMKDLYPTRKHLYTKRCLRCIDCARNVCKPEYHPLSIKFKVQGQA